MPNTITMTSDELADMIRRLKAPDGWLTIQEAAARAKTSARMVYKWVKDGELPAYAPTDRRLVRVGDLDRLVRRHRVMPGETSIHGDRGTEHLAAWREKKESEKETTGDGT